MGWNPLTGGTANSVTDATQLQATSGAVSVGDVICVGLQFHTNLGATDGVLTDNLGNVYNFVDGQTDTTNNQRAEVWFASVTTAGTPTVTLQFEPTPGSTQAGNATMNVDPFSYTGISTPAYSTTFASNENPISEGGLWINIDETTTKVQTTGGSAYGTQADGPFGPYDDSSAYLTNFGSNYEVEGVIIVSASLPDTPNTEVEILLRWTDDNAVRSTSFGDTHIFGYETTWHHNGNYMNLSRFKDDAGLASATSPPAPANGDTFRGRIEGQRIRIWVNDVLQIDYTDNAAGFFDVGNPGMGFFWRTGASNTQFGFSSIKIAGLKVADGTGAAQVQTAPGTGTDAVTSGTWTTSTGGDLIYAVTCQTNTGNDPGSVGTSFTELQTSGGVIIITEYRTQTSAGSIAGTFTTSAGSETFATAAMALEPPEAPPGPIAGSGGWSWPRRFGATIEAVGAAASGLYYIIRRRREGTPHE